MKSSTPEEQAESDLAAEIPPQASADGRQAALTALFLLVGIVVLALVRPRLAGTIGVLAAIIAMIMLHELGHFVMAKRAGMKVTEFFLGFGPRLWSIRRGETEYGVKAIPAGGYVRIIGMSNVDAVLDRHDGGMATSVEDVIDADRRARVVARTVIAERFSE